MKETNINRLPPHLQHCWGDGLCIRVAPHNEVKEPEASLREASLGENVRKCFGLFVIIFLLYNRNNLSLLIITSFRHSIVIPFVSLSNTGVRISFLFVFIF